MKILSLDLGPWNLATRPKKIAGTLSKLGQVTYIGFEAAGRTGRRLPADFQTPADIDVQHIRIGNLESGSTAFVMLRNVFLSYVPAYFRLARAGLSTPAQIVIAEDPSLLPLAYLHRFRFKSTLAYDCRERPGQNEIRSSISSWVSQIEPFLIRRLPQGSVVLTVGLEHVKDLEELTDVPVVALYNAPDWEPHEASGRNVQQDLEVALLGTLTADRGAREIVEAVRGLNGVSLTIGGFGSKSFVREIQALADGEQNIRFLGPLTPSEIQATYQRVQVACVLYDSTTAGNDSMPNKLFEAMACGCAILQAEQAQARALVEGTGIGVSCELTPGALRAALVRLRDNEDERFKMASAAVNLYESSYRWRVQEETLKLLMTGAHDAPYSR